MSTKALFPTYIYDAALQPRGAAAFNEELLREAALFRREDVAGRAWSKENYPGGYTSYGSLNKLHKVSSTFTELQEKVDRHVRAFVKTLEWELPRGKALEMTDCWLNIMPRRAAHGLHLHPTSVISGTYYVQTPPGCAGIKFEDPRLPMLMAAPTRTRDAPEALRTFVTLTPAPGTVLMWESWLRHEVPANAARTPRISVSFNYGWR